MAIMLYTIGFVIINIFLLAWIFIIQAKNVKLIKSPFPIGLLLFVFIFLIQNLFAFYFYVTMMPLFVDGLDVPVLIITILETIAFGVYLYLTHK